MPGFDAVVATMVSALWLAPPPDQPVPLQRPGQSAPEPAQPPAQPEAPAEPTPVDPVAPEPAPVEPAQPTVVEPPQPTVVEPPQPSVLEPASQPTGAIDGVVTDAEVEDFPVEGVNVVLMCPCLRDPLVAVTDADGHFEFNELRAGQYTIRVDRGGAVSRDMVSLPEGAKRRAYLVVAPPITTVELEDERRALTRGRGMIAVGSIGAVAAALMFIGAGVEAAKPECKFDGEGCDDPRRPRLIAGLAVTGGILAVGGGALIWLGVRKVRRVEARLQLDGRTAGVTLSGRF